MWHIWQRAGMIVGCGILHLILEEFFRKLGGFFVFGFFFGYSGRCIQLA